MDILNALLAYVHFGAMMLLAALICAEFMLLRQALDARAVELLARVDIAYVTCGVLMLLSGATRFGTTAKGVAYYGSNGVFWLKILLYGMLALASLFMSWRYSRWTHLVRMDMSFHVPPPEVTSTRRVVEFQIVLLAILPLLAVFMARGIGF